MEIEEAAALGYSGQSCRNGLPDALPHGLVFAQGLGVELRIPSRQVQPVDVRRQRLVPKSAEKDRLRAASPQSVQIVLVEKAEGLVPGHGDAAAGWNSRGSGAWRAGAVRQVQKAGDVHGPLHLSGQDFDPRGEVRDFSSGQQP